MRLGIIIILFFVALSFRFDKGILIEDFSQSQNDQILWTKNHKLSWDDFQGQPDTLSKYKALTFSTIDVVNVKNTLDSKEYNVTCLFEKKFSWSKNKKSKDLLLHEQLHFDITEFSTMKLRKNISALIHDDKNSSKELVKLLFNVAEKSRDSVQFKYDTETNHGLIADKQKEWEQKNSFRVEKT